MTFLNLFLLACTLTGAFANAQDVALARAGELGCHRIERLRDLGRIDEGYLNKFQALRIEDISTGGAKFRFTAFQAPGLNGSAHQIELLMDSAGKTIGNHKETKNTDGVSPVWPDKDPVTLTESGFHYIIENEAINPDVRPFFIALSEAVIAQVQENGQTVAKVQFKNTQSAKVLEVTLKTDGTVISTQVK